MSNLKRRYLEVTLAVVILLIITFAGGHVFGADKPVKPLVDFMFTPPNSIYADYGYGDETFQLYNFVRLKEICQIHEAQIAALRAEVDELKKLVALQEKIVDALSEAVLTNTRSLHAAKIPFIEKAIIPHKTYNVDDHSIVVDPNEVANLKEGVWTDYTVYPREVSK